MLVLGIETATRACSVAVLEDERLLCELTLLVDRAHSVRLMPLVQQAIAEAGRTRGDLDAVAVGVGPGSFTGLRIGVATAKSLAFALGKPALGVGTLDALAWGAGAVTGLVVPLLDAGRGDVYAAAYRSDGAVAGGAGQSERVHLAASGPWILRRESGPMLAPLDHWLASLLRVGEQLLFTGEGAEKHWSAIAAALGGRACLVPVGLRHPRGWAVAHLGLGALAGGAAGDPASVLPLYLRRSQAEVLWDQRAEAAAKGE